jgi:hypothetical protein
MWWAEFQKRGALHYHAIIIDAPFADEGEARRWFTDHWHKQLPQLEHRVQPDVQWRSAPWFRKYGGNYVLGDVRKLGGKHYQQDYTRMPRLWRTFRTHQLTRTVAEHLEHETKAWTACTAPPEASWDEKRRSIVVYRVDHHVPRDGGCHMVTRRRRPRSSPSLPAAPPRGYMTFAASGQGNATTKRTQLRPAFSEAPLASTGGSVTHIPPTGCGAVAPRRSLDATAAGTQPPEVTIRQEGRQMTNQRASL